jgi:hypothetical protein
MNMRQERGQRTAQCFGISRDLAELLIHEGDASPALGDSLVKGIDLNSDGVILSDRPSTAIQVGADAGQRSVLSCLGIGRRNGW